MKNEQKRAFQLAKEGNLSVDIDEGEDGVVTITLVPLIDEMIDANITLIKNVESEEIPPPHAGYLYVSYVYSNPRNQGFGTLLYKEALKYVIRNGYKGLASEKSSRQPITNHIWNSLKTSENRYYDYADINALFKMKEQRDQVNLTS